jgi:hypothetical protein
MDQVVGAALAATGRLVPLLAGRRPLD